MIKNPGNHDVRNGHRVSRSLLKLRPFPRLSHSRWRTLVPGLSIVGAILFAGGVFTRTATEPASTAEPSVLAVATQAAQQESGYAVAREFVGRVEARRQSQLSLELGGMLTAVLFDEGDLIHQGDVVASLDTQILNSRKSAITAQLAGAQAGLQEMLAGPRVELIDAARAEVQRWEAQQRLSDVTLERQRQLLAHNAGSNQDLDDASFGKQVVAAQLSAAHARLLELENGTRKEQIAAQEAAVSQLESELRTIEINLAKSSLRAPYDGVVSERFIDEGTVITAGTPVIELMEVGQLDVRVGVSADVIPRLTPGRELQVTVNNKRYAAVTHSIRPDRNRATRTVTVLMTLDPCGDLIHFGDLATVQIENRIEEPGFWLPISALTESYRGLWGCYVAEPVDDSIATHRLRLRELEVVHQTSDAAYVRGSLKHGERVVSDGTQRLVADQQIRLAGSPTALTSIDAASSMTLVSAKNGDSPTANERSH